MVFFGFSVHFLSPYSNTTVSFFKNWSPQLLAQVMILASFLTRLPHDSASNPSFSDLQSRVDRQKDSPREQEDMLNRPLATL